jgi:hypothetical protein
MYVFSNVTLSPTGMTGSSSPIALALFPFGDSRGTPRACRDGDGRGRGAGPRSAAVRANRFERGTRAEGYAATRARECGRRGESAEASNASGFL